MSMSMVSLSVPPAKKHFHLRANLINIYQAIVIPGHIAVLNKTVTKALVTNMTSKSMLSVTLEKFITAQDVITLIQMKDC